MPAREVLEAWRHGGKLIEKFARTRGVVAQRRYRWRTRLGMGAEEVYDHSTCQRLWCCRTDSPKMTRGFDLLSWTPKESSKWCPRKRIKPTTSTA